MTGATAIQKANSVGEINQWNRQDLLPIYSAELQGNKPESKTSSQSKEAKEFCALFSVRESYICRSFGAKAEWRTWRGPLEDYQILAVIGDGGRGVYRGCHWGQETRYAVLDVDAGTSQYYSQEELRELLGKLEAVGLRATVYQSSDSGGWHLYIPFAEKEESKEVGATLKRWLRALGYEIKGGQLEVFPGGNALRLPLQPGFAWLKQDGTLIRTREELSVNEALALFMKDLETDARNWTEAKRQIESQIEEIANAGDANAQEHEDRLGMQGFEHVLCRGKIRKIWEKGQKWWREGLQKDGDRHNAILAVGHYLWYGDEEGFISALPGMKNAEWRAQLILEWLKRKHNEHCNHINRGDWKTVKEDIRRATYWRQDKEAWVKEHYPLTSRLLKRLIALYRRTGQIWSIEKFEKANQTRKKEARERIAAAIVNLEKEGREISINAVAKRAKADWKTVKKNWDLLAYVVAADNLKEAGNKGSETNRGNSRGSGGVNSLGGLLLPAACTAKVGDCLQPVFVQREPNTFSQDTNKSAVNLAVEANYTIEESPKSSQDGIKEHLGISESNQNSQKNQIENTEQLNADVNSNSSIDQLVSPLVARKFFSLNDHREELENSEERARKESKVILIGGARKSGSKVRAPIDLMPAANSCPAKEPTTCTQYQDQALRVPAEVLTPGPMQRGFWAVLQESAAGSEPGRKGRRVRRAQNRGEKAGECGGLRTGAKRQEKKQKQPRAVAASHCRRTIEPETAVAGVE